MTRRESWPENSSGWIVNGRPLVCRESWVDRADFCLCSASLPSLIDSNRRWQSLCLNDSIPRSLLGSRDQTPVAKNLRSSESLYFGERSGSSWLRFLTTCQPSPSFKSSLLARSTIFRASSWLSAPSGFVITPIILWAVSELRMRSPTDCTWKSDVALTTASTIVRGFCKYDLVNSCMAPTAPGLCLPVVVLISPGRSYYITGQL